MKSWMLAAPRGVLELLLRGLGPAQTDVLLDGAVEQEGVLVHHRDQGPDLGKRQGAQVVAAQQDAALVGIE